QEAPYPSHVSLAQSLPFRFRLSYSMSWEEPTYILYYDQTQADYSTFDRKITLRFAYELQNHQHTNLPIFYIASTSCTSASGFCSMSRLRNERNVWPKSQRHSSNRFSPFWYFRKTST